jgi:hypothetical protein
LNEIGLTHYRGSSVLLVKRRRSDANVPPDDPKSYLYCVVLDLRLAHKTFQAKYNRLTKYGTQGGSHLDHQKSGRTVEAGQCQGEMASAQGMLLRAEEVGTGVLTYNTSPSRVVE